DNACQCYRRLKMFEIKFTLDATHELISALRDIAGAIHGVSNHAPTLASDAMRGDTREEKDGAAEKAQNLTAEATAAPERPEAQESVEEPKKRKPRAKKAPSESATPVAVAPAVGDNLSPIVNAEPDQKDTTAPEPDPDAAPVADNPATENVTPETPAVEDTPADPAAPAPEPLHEEEARADQVVDPLAGKGQTGEILAELTRKAIADLDALGVDRGDANRRIRDYCARNEINFPTFPALLNAVGYAEAIEICKGA
ncbi:MAG: hypothetical protein ACI4SV_02980, partial [Duodenibacillus sp.]